MQPGCSSTLCRRRSWGRSTHLQGGSRVSREGPAVTRNWTSGGRLGDCPAWLRPSPCKMAASAVHVIGAPAPPPGGRAEDWTPSLASPGPLQGEAGAFCRARTTWMVFSGNAKGKLVWQRFYCPGSNLLDTCLKLFNCFGIILFLTPA